jgi:hypothetical protein
MDVVALSHCRPFEVLLKIANPVKTILWRLWHTLPGADKEDCQQKFIEWMAGNLMSTHKVKNFFDLIDEKVADNIQTCMRMAGIVPGPDAGKRKPTKPKWKRKQQRAKRKQQRAKRQRKRGQTKRKR